MSLIKEDRVHFYGLDELRAIAALLVYFHHVEQFKREEKYSNLMSSLWLGDFIRNIGQNAVIMFFVLSGFLITYLLIKEKERTGSINIKAFYFRRILRIWPLYYIVLIIGFVIIPLLSKLDYFQNQSYFLALVSKLDYNSLPMYLLFLSNIAPRFYNWVAGVSQTWSVSIEEQFYIIWPHIIKWGTTYLRIIVYAAILIFSKYLLIYFLEIYFYSSIVRKVLVSITIEYMFVGTIVAVTYVKYNQTNFFKKIFSNKLLFAIFSLGLIYLLFFIAKCEWLISFFIGLIILFLITVKPKNKLLGWFGKISYGIYMYHPFLLFVSFSICKHLFDDVSFGLMFYIMTFFSTILISFLSYKYIEMPILKFKSS